MMKSKFTIFTNRGFGALSVIMLLGLSALAAIDAPIAAAQDRLPAGVELNRAGTMRAPGQIMIKLKPGFKLDGVATPEAVPAELQFLLAKLGVTKLKSLGDGTNVLLLYTPLPVDSAIQIAQADPGVVQADANYVVKTNQAIAPAPNDPIYLDGRQWWLDRIHAREAWTITTGDRNLRVGVVDDGIDALHPAFAGRIAAAYDFTIESSNSTPGIEGHGTSVSGCITGKSNDGVGTAALADVTLIDGNAFGKQPFGFSFDLVRGDIFAINKGARVVNNSWGGGGLNLATVAMAEYAYEKNVVLVFSAGNSGNNEPQLPAALSQVYPNIIAVGATDFNDNVTGFSTFGAQVNVVAPGSGIWTTEPGGGYRAINGTSFSSPITTGIVALMLSANPSLTPAEVRNILEGTADDISGQGFTIKTGYGRVNAYKAVLAAKNGDTFPNKRSRLTGQVSGVDPAKVRLSLDPVGLTFKPKADGTFSLPNLGNATYRLRAAVAGQGTGQGVVEFKLNGTAGSNYQANFAFQNVKASASDPDNYVDQARYFDMRTTAATGSRYFSATGHNLGGAFQPYWEQNGGLAIFGYPISEQFTEVSPTDGKLYTVQYFERNRFELHPENAGTPYEVLLGLLGSEQTAGRNFAAGIPITGATWFSETNQALSGRFLEYWKAQGGLAIFGYPISPIIEEDGRQVQYFERNRFELHPENAGTPYQVLLGLLGVKLARQRGYVL